MLRELHISGLGVIEDADLEPHPGLTVLTGETGAGKTMVTVGLALAIGARGSASLVRPGATAARVQARFDAPASAAEWAEDGELLLARSIAPDGRSSARVGGQLATASGLAELGGTLVEIHGQHQTLRLLDPATQAAFLDRSAGDAHLVAVGRLRETFRRYAAVRAARDELAEASRERERELDLLAYQVREIEAVAPRVGEAEALAAEEARLGHVERLLELAGEAGAGLVDDGAAADALAGVAGALGAAADLDPDVDELASRARALASEAAELARDVRSYREALAADPGRLDEVRARLGALRELRRKYGATEQDVLDFLAEAAGRLDALGGADERLAELEAELVRLGAEVEAGAVDVSAGRRRAAPPLADAIAAELRDLGMPGAAVTVDLEPLPAVSADGAERVELRFSPGPDGPALPLAKGASGGELSRVMLACRSVLADLDEVATLVLDEVDAGIGGEAGLAVGRRLARLAADRQVIVVTHLPQIACFGDLHVRVRKRGGAARVEPLDADERVRELSRMLAGLEGSEAAASHAGELLAEADRWRGARGGRAATTRRASSGAVT
ncbi:MAG TPA: DNA repair protein RecN [Actinomycetota bacterium]